ncbi:MAG: winged helix-turn-helix transcriptional regulator [Thermoplasmatota archaeon]
MNSLLGRVVVSLAIVFVFSLPLLGYAARGGGLSGEAPFALPASHAGDAAQYRVGAGEGWADVQNWTVTARRAFEDGQGVWHDVRAARIEFPPRPRNATPPGGPPPPDPFAGCGQAAQVGPDYSGWFLWDDLTRAELAGGVGGALSSGVQSGNPVTGYTCSGERFDFTQLFPGASTQVCGFVNPLQGAVDPVPTSFRACGLVFHVLAVDRQATPATMSFLARGPSYMTDAGTRSFSVQADFQADVPYPTRITSLVNDEPVYAITLTGFARGPSDPPAPLLPMNRLLPAVSLEPWGTFGPSDQPAFNVSLAQAFWDAHNDARWSTLRDWLQAHPRWFLSQAHNTATNGTYGWQFTLTAPDATLVVMAHYAPNKGYAPSPLPGPLAAAGPHVDKSFSDDSYDWGAPVAPPAIGPAPRSVIARWAAWDPQAPGIALWGFDFRCRGTCASGAMDAGDLPLMDNSGFGDGSPASLPAGTAAHAAARPTLTHNMSALFVAFNGSVIELETGVEHAEVVRTSSFAAAAPARGGERHIVPPFEGALAFSPAVAVGASGLGLVAGLAYYVSSSARAGALGLFSRVQQSQLLGNPNRRRIVTAVESQPGIHYQELRRLTGLAKGTLEHHLGKLTAGGLVIVRRGPGYTCYFAPGTPAAVMAGGATLKSEGAKRILAAIQGRPGSSAQDVAAAASLDAGTVTYHVQRLGEAGLVSMRREGRFLRLYPMGEDHAVNG